MKEKSVSIQEASSIHQGQAIAQYRKAKKWSQSDLAEALHVDVRTVQRMETQNMIKSIERRQLLIGLLGIPAALLALEGELPKTSRVHININKDQMSFLEDIMTTRWDMYHTGGTVRAAQGLDVWIREITSFSKSAQGSTWHIRTLSLLCMSYQLKSCLARDMMDYNQAHLAFRKAYTIAKELNDPELMGSALAREGVTFIQQEAPIEATKYLSGALNNINHLGLPDLRGYTLQALSEAYAKSQQPNECWQSVRLAERILERPGDLTEQSRCRFSTASITAQKGVNAVLLHDYERAISLIDKSLISYDPTFIRGRARLTAQKAEAYQGLGLIDTCAITAEEALNLAKSVGSNKTTARINVLYSNLTQSSWRKEPSIARLGALLR